jgi:hypothetical protein
MPVLTPLTRRHFKSGSRADTLRPWAEAAIRAATETTVPLVDLHAESLAAVGKMGRGEANTLALAPAAAVEPNRPAGPAFDYTHLGANWAAFFARMVATGLGRAVPAVAPNFRPE